MFKFNYMLLLPSSATHRQKTLTDKFTLLCVLKYFKSYRHVNARRSLVTFWVKLSFLQIIKVQVKWHIFSYNAGLNSKYLYFYGTIRCQKTVKYKGNLNTKLPFLQKIHIRPSCIQLTIWDMSVVTFFRKKLFLNLYALWWNFPCQLYCIGFCISQVKLCISGSHIFKILWQDTRNMLGWSHCKLFYSFKRFGII